MKDKKVFHRFCVRQTIWNKNKCNHPLVKRRLIEGSHLQFKKKLKIIKCNKCSLVVFGTLVSKMSPTSQSPGLSRSQAQSASQEKKFDLLSDLGGDIFAAPPTQTATSSNFANFAHFPNQTGKSFFFLFFFQ